MNPFVHIWQRHRTPLFAITAFAVCSIAAAVRSPGFVESDGAMHYLFARFAFQQPIFFVDVWGRPLCTALLAVPARFGGLIGARMMSLAIAIGCGLVAMAIARGQALRWPALSLIFTLGQPLLFLHSFSELTELPFALVIGLAFLAYQRERWGAMAILAAIAPLGRPEGFVFLPLAAAALIGHRRWGWLLMLPLGLIAWSFAGHELIGPATAPWWRWLADHWPYESGSEYPRGNVLFFLGVLPMVVGPLVFPAMWIGAWIGLSGAWALPRLREHKARVGFLIAALPLAILVGHSLLFWLGKLSSSGSPRYLLIVAPLWGCLTAGGWEFVFNRLGWRRPLSWAALAVVVPGLVNYAWRILPIQQTPSWSAAQRVVAWYKADDIRKQYPRVMSNHPGVFYYLDASPWDRRFVEPWSGQSIDQPPAGVLLIWDPEFCVRNSDPKLVAPLGRVIEGGWVNDWWAQRQSNVNNPPASEMGNAAMAHSPLVWHIFRSPLDAEGNPVTLPDPPVDFLQASPSQRSASSSKR